MPDFDYDYFVIGAGSGGVRSSRIAASHGARVAVAEEYRVGGTCVIRGCVPKKLLVLGAQFARQLQQARNYGWEVGNAEFGWTTLRDNVLAEVDRLNGLYHQTLANNAVESLAGRATIVGPQQVAVNGKTYRARHILVATGATPVIPEIPGAELGVTSNELFHLDALPRRVFIVGAGFIANEFAGVFNALGVDVTLVVRSDVVLRGWDQGVVKRMIEHSEAKGIKFLLNTKITKVEKLGDAVRMTTQSGEQHEADLLVWAIGRAPNSAGLGLEEAGAKLGKRGAVAVDINHNCGPEWLHAVGDVTDRVQLTPVAIREGHALADRLFGNKNWHVDYDLIASAVFSDPPLAGVGLTEEEAREIHNDVKIFTSDFNSMHNVFAKTNERVLYKLVVNPKTDQVIGAHMIGPEAPEILQALAIAIKAGVTKAQLDETFAIHPTMAEELVLMR